MNVRCAMEDCQTQPVAQVHAQWTLVDFVDYAVCEEHVDQALEQLAVRQVDDRRPVDVWVTYWDTGEDFGFGL